MSYQAQDQLTQDVVFQGRNRSVCTQQAMSFKDDARPDWVAVALEVLRGDSDTTMAFVRLAAAGPGIAEKADAGDGTVDQSNVLDADLLALTQANWPVVASLFAEAGLPK